MLQRISEKVQERCIATVLLAGLVVILIPLLAIAKYNLPSVDDYAFATMAGYSFGEEFSFFEILLVEIKNAYIQWRDWQGLYFSNWVSLTINALCMREYYYLTPLFSLGFLVVAELVAGCSVMKVGFGSSRALAMIFVIPCVALQVLLIPSPVEGFYWMCGSTIYTMMLAITFLYLAAETCLLCDGGTQTRLWKILVVLGTVAVGGSNYICMMLVIGIDACMLLYAFWKKNPHRRFWVFKYVLLIGCVLLCVLSPGSAKRQAGAGEHLPAMEAILRSFTESYTYIKTWSILPVILLVIFMLPVAWKIVSVRKYRYPLPVLFTLGTYCIFSMLFTPNLYALGIIGAYRIQNIYRISMYIMYFANLLYWTGYLQRILARTSIPDKINGSRRPLLGFGYFAVAGSVTMLLILYYGGSTVTSLSAFRSLRNGTAEEYYSTYEQRLNILEDETVTDVILPAYVDAPYVLFFGDVKTEADAWENQALATYYHKNSVVLEP